MGRTEADEKWHLVGDVLSYINDPPFGEEWDLMIAHPPCTYLTVTGNKWFKPEFKKRFPERPKQRGEAVKFFLALANASIPKIAIENPVGIMSTVYRKPNQIIQPWQFGHFDAKATCLWLKGLPRLRFGKIQPMLFDDKTLSDTEIKDPEYVTFASGKRMAKWYVEASKADRARIRSKTFSGIAQAMAEQWG